MSAQLGKPDVGVQIGKGPSTGGSSSTDWGAPYTANTGAMQATGILQQTYSAPTATPSVLTLGSGQVVFGAASGLATSSSRLTFTDAAAARLNVVTTGGAGLILDGATSANAQFINLNFAGVNFSQLNARQTTGVSNTAAWTLTTLTGGNGQDRWQVNGVPGTGSGVPPLIVMTAKLTGQDVGIGSGEALVAASTYGFAWAPQIAATPSGGAPSYVGSAAFMRDRQPFVFCPSDGNLYWYNTGAAAWKYQHFTNYTPATARIPFGATAAGDWSDSANFKYNAQTGFLVGGIAATPARTDALLDRVLFDAATVAVSGTAGALAGPWAYARIAPPTFTGATAAITGQPSTLEIDGPVYGSNFNSGGGGPNGFALLLSDNVAQGTANLGLADSSCAIFAANIVGWGSGAADLSLGIQAGTSLFFKYGVAADGSGGSTSANMDPAGNWTINGISALAGTTNGLTVDANGNVRLGKDGALLTTATKGFPYMPSMAGAPTGAPTFPFSFGVPFVFDTTNAGVWLKGSGGGAWQVIPVAQNTGAGAQALTINNGPAGIGAPAARWETYVDAAGVQSYRPYWQ